MRPATASGARASCLQVADPTAFESRRAPERAITCYKRKIHSAWGDFTDYEKLCVGSRDHESSDPKGWFAESVALVLAPPDEYVPSLLLLEALSSAFRPVADEVSSR